MREGSMVQKNIRRIVFTVLFIACAMVPAFAVTQKSCTATSVTFNVKGEYELSSEDEVIKEGTGNGDVTVRNLEEEAEYTLTTEDETISVFTRNGDKTPLEVVGDTELTYNTATQRPSVTVLEDGEEIPSSKYVRSTVEGDSRTPGEYEMQIKFRNGIHEPIYVPYTIAPKTQQMQEIDASTSSVTMRIYNQKGETTVRYSTSESMSNAKTATSESDRITLKGMQKGKTYYVEQYTTVNGMRSDVTEMEVKTAGSPAYSANDPFVKTVVSRVKAAEKKSPSSFTVETPYATFGNTAKVIRAMEDAYPEYFGAYKVEIYPTYLKMTRQSGQVDKAKKHAKALNSYVKSVKKKKGAKARVKYLNKLMCKKVSYDYAAYKYWKKNNHQAGKYQTSYEAYGALVNRKAVCMGYTYAFNSVCFRLGIPAQYVSDSSHAWSKVKVGKKWYFVDVTGNDTSKRTTKYLLKTKHRGKVA